MKLIGVYGGSGAGKSTVTNILNQLLDDSVVLHLDPFMHKYTYEKADELCKKFGLTERPVHLLSFIAGNHGDNVVWMDTIKDDVERDAIDFIEAYSDMNYIIVDWAFLTYTNLFNKCDYTILVDGDDELKFARLKARLAQSGKLGNWEDQYIRQRVKGSKKNCEGGNPSFTILNDNEHSLADQLTNIASNIAEENNIPRKRTTL